MSTQDLSGKVALITGTSRGIGATIAGTLTAADAKVIGTATSESGAAAISERLAQWGGGDRVLDSAESETIENLIADIEEEFSKLDILVNNAGITRDNLLIRMKEEKWDDITQANLKSVFRASKTILRGVMKQRADRIVNITLVVGVMGNVGQTSYTTAKAGLIGFSESVAREVGSRDITVDCIAPGSIDTDMTHVLPEETRKTFETQILLGKFGEAQGITGAVLLLVSDQTKYITGQALRVNGGILMS